ncbi:MAG: N,N-dimethylformamidase beta subunit family domain-containing protein, partial [Candidatus Velthaea sp.]
MTRAYPEEVTVEAGARLVLRVSTTAERFRVRLHRAVPFAPAGEPSAWFAGTNAPSGRCDRPWKWPPYTLPIPQAFESGAYIAVIEEAGGAPPAAAPDARSGTALFVVRAPAARVLVNLPLFTYHAYNVADVDGTRGEGEGECLYSGPSAVTLHRPGGGTGGHPWDEVNADVYDRASPRQTFAHWDSKGLAWLHAAGYDADVCTDLDLHDAACDRSRYDVVLAFGHHEYWTREMRAHLEAFAADGGGIAFFGGNTCWFRVRYDGAKRAIARDGQWDDDPEERFTGASYRYGGGKWRGGRPALGYTVHDDLHWMFAGAA